jgi:hypothetical protein
LRTALRRSWRAPAGHPATHALSAAAIEQLIIMVGETIIGRV